VRWKTDNYNNLMEQPTLFYALVVTLAVLGAGSGVNLILAWLYVGLRVAHSLVQATVNRVAIRFSLFIAGTLVLLVIAIRTSLIVF
jgi:hypothetical protein